MGILALILIFILALPFAGAFGTYRIVHTQLIKAGNKIPKTISVLLSILSFVVVFMAIYFIIDKNFRIER
jgi:hypothetical protein